MIPGIVILSVMLLGGIWQRRNEKREWNNGICAESGKPWRKFDSDSQDGRGYTDGVNYCWISYVVDIPENVESSYA
jgi:hypothetical protein